MLMFDAVTGAGFEGISSVFKNAGQVRKTPRCPKRLPQLKEQAWRSEDQLQNEAN